MALRFSGRSIVTVATPRRPRSGCGPWPEVARSAGPGSRAVVRWRRVVRAIRTPDQRLRVFISSTLGELADERQAARASVEQLRLTPVMFELGARPTPAAGPLPLLPRPVRCVRRHLLAALRVGRTRHGDLWARGRARPLDGLPRLVYVKRPAPDMEPRLAEMLDRLEDEDTASYKPFRDAAELHASSWTIWPSCYRRFDGDGRRRRFPTRPRHNLPAQTSTFLGREAELDDLRRLIADDDVRLISLTGAGGTGKTRLAIRAAVRGAPTLHRRHLLRRPERRARGRRAFDAVARRWASYVASDARPARRARRGAPRPPPALVLDNLEQVTTASVGIVGLLERCPHLKVLVTSREALRVRGARVFPVPPLSLPDLGDVRSAGESEAVRLFCDRATAVQPGGRGGEGLAFIEEAQAALEDGDPMGPDVGIVHGELLLALTPPDVPAADAEFQRAAELAADRGARMAQLQALTHLAVLRCGAAGEAEAVHTLREVYDRFTEGFDSPHLVAARAALAR